MSTVPLRKFVEHAAERASRVFNRAGEFLPMYHYIDRDGKDFVVPAPPTQDKDAAVAIVRAVLEACGATRVAFLDEAWMLDAQRSGFDFEQANRDGISKHPDRIEVLLISAEDQNEGLVMASREIIRHDNRVVLGKLKFMPDGGELQGRMVGLLPAPERKH